MTPLPRLLPGLLAATVGLAGCVTQPTEHTGNLTVESVIDGDTLRLTIDGTSERVRILGIDSPETDPPESCAAEATAHLEQLIGTHPVTIVQSAHAPTRDRYGRLLAFVETAGGDAGLSLLEAGLAEPYRSQSHERQAEYESAAQDAEPPACAP